jgi:membrane-associated phospholipid phosphatase
VIDTRYVYFLLYEVEIFVNPVLVGIWAGQVLIDVKDRCPNWLTFAISSFIAVIVTQIANHEFRNMNFMPPNDSFPSGHETFAASVITSLTIRERRWFWLLLPFAFVLGMILVLVHAHDPIDVVGALVLTPPFTYLCHKITRDRTLSTA